MLSLTGAALSIVIWRWLAGYIGKQKSWSLGMMLMGIGFLGLGFLAPGERSYLRLLTLMILIHSGIATITLLANSLLSDIVDYTAWKYYRSCGAILFAIFALVAKSNFAIGGALALAVASQYGFDPSANFYSKDAIQGIRLGVAWLPATTVLCSTVFILSIPINERFHRLICRRLERRMQNPLVQGC